MKLVLTLSASQPADGQSGCHVNNQAFHLGSPEGRHFMTIEELQKLKERAQRHLALHEGEKKYRVVFSMGTSAIAACAREVMTTVLDELDKRGSEHVEVSVSGEMGLCVEEPVVRVEGQGGVTVTYANVTPTTARRIVVEHLERDKVVEGLAVGKVKGPPEGK